ncbi:hypothetical protein AB4212_55710, partial [Streptomyces sp. 2MCAF27]
MHALGDSDRKAIKNAYQAKLNPRRGVDPFDVEWSDGIRRDLDGDPVDNYSSKDEYEYFAQAVNAYLGVNTGTDPYTGRPRNNGAAWVREHEPALMPILRRLFGHYENMLDDAERRVVQDAYRAKLNPPRGFDPLHVRWPDGIRRDLAGNPTDNYSSTSESAYFAQAVNAYLGLNAGTDPYTGRPRNNGAAWVREHEPALMPILRRLFGHYENMLDDAE